MAKRKAKEPDKAASGLPLITLIDEVKRRAKDVEPLLASGKKPQPHEIDSAAILLRVSALYARGLDSNPQNDRHEIAAEIARLIGLDTYNANRVNKLAAPSQSEYNPRPDEIVGHRWATDSTMLIEYLCQSCGGYFVRPDEYALIELGRIMQADDELGKARANILAQVSEYRGGQS